MQDAVADVEKGSDETGHKPSESTDRSGRPWTQAPIDDSDRRNGSAKRETAFDGQIGKIENAETQKCSECDNSKDEANLYCSEEFISAILAP